MNENEPTVIITKKVGIRASGPGEKTVSALNLVLTQEAINLAQQTGKKPKEITVNDYIKAQKSSCS